jgi:tetratricopeptide (TPR) repeat protein
MELSIAGRHRDALKILDDLLLKATREGRTVWMAVLCSNAAIIADRMNDLELARKYCEKLVASNPDNALALYSLADNLYRQGHREMAKEYAIRSHQICLQRLDTDHRALSDLILQRWPDIGQRRGS